MLIIKQENENKKIQIVKLWMQKIDQTNLFMFL